MSTFNNMSKGMKIGLGVGGGLVLVVFAVWFFMLKPASPKAICNNVYKLVEKEGDYDSREEVEEAIGKFDECVKDEEKRFENSTKGMVSIAKITKCEAKADSLKEAGECSDK